MPASAATSPQMNVLIADSNRMQAQLLTGALRRRSEFQISGCQMNSASILESVALQCPRVALLCFSASGDLPRGSAPGICDPASISLFSSRN